MIRYLFYFSYFFCTVVVAASHHPESFLARIQNTPDEGEQIVQHFCGTCHAQKALIPLGAPKPKDTKDWQPRLEQGLDVLFQHTNAGVRAMPPRGGCFECTDAQLWLAIKALLPPHAIDKDK